LPAVGAGPTVGTGPTVGAAVASGRARLADAGCQTPRLDAELLLAHVLDVGRERLMLDRDRALPVSALPRWEELLARREAREPVAYILGRREFRRVTLTVDPRVLIPRPETELLVEVGLELDAGARVVDVGSGSGAVALALKDERPDLVVRATDVSPEAVAVARANAARLGLDVGFAQCDLLDGEPFDAVLANLPYVVEGAVLAPEIERYEPPLALFAGADGLDVVRRLIVMAGVVGLIALEIASAQAAEVAGLLRAAGYRGVEVRRDLARLDRVVVGRA
ncbi:MAG: peptide chain release factor N(5)-glutamine methyltransferase, partial [Solirubrobacteraceae bacterium]